MKKFAVTQAFDASSDEITRAFRSQHTWQGFQGLPFVGDPILQSFVQAEPVEIAMSYRVTLDLPPLADRFIEPDKLTFVELTQMNVDGTGSFEIVPDHYARLLKASGFSHVVSLGTGRCERIVDGWVDVSLGWSGKLFEGPVEDAIVTGLKNALSAQATQVI